MSTPVGNVPTLEHVQACCDDGGREAILWSHCCWEKAGFVWLHSGSHLLKHYRMASEAMRLETRDYETVGRTESLMFHLATQAR